MSNSSTSFEQIFIRRSTHIMTALDVVCLLLLMISFIIGFIWYKEYQEDNKLINIEKKISIIMSLIEKPIELEYNEDWNLIPVK